MCFLAFVCHSAQWRAAVIGIGNALASLSLILITLGYKVGNPIFLFGIISPLDQGTFILYVLDDKQWHKCTYSVLINCIQQAAKLRNSYWTILKMLLLAIHSTDM